ncbi:MAG: 4Fe-4S dicluster domain-containing protein [Nitrospinota bacterium]
MAELKKMLVVRPENCTACRLCELACSLAKTGTFNPTESRIQVHLFLDEPFFVPLVCMQCTDAPCENVCPTAALKRNGETAVVEFTREKCIGCKTCMMACPFGVMNFSSRNGHVFKCDNCQGDPECVKFCVFDALDYREAELSMAAKRAAFARQLREAQRTRAASP